MSDLQGPSLGGSLDDVSGVAVARCEVTASEGPSGHMRSMIDRAIAGDESALRWVWGEHRRWVAAVLLAHMPKTAEVDDLLQEVAVTLVGKIGSVREAGAFKPWLRAVAISVAKTAARKGVVRKNGFLRVVGFTGKGDDEREDREWGVGGGGDGAGSFGAALCEGRRLMNLSSDLPDGYREPLLLKCVRGMSYRQIGQVMGLPETTIETRIARARRMLRDRAIAAGVGSPHEVRHDGSDDGNDDEDREAGIRTRTNTRATTPPGTRPSSGAKP